ncbi:hypothetical protein [Synechococcus sp. PCC 7336]|uniref:hypothetical protein n=1 Tax=Synechococcus sp. PCC 7336 TaxID=195250 RepID=UPI0003487B75|nr:hypothetical protein [Synechococcus sp. PCC 7336]
MWGRPSRLDRIEQTVERLAEISEATNLRIDRFVEASGQQIQAMNQRTEQLRERTEQLQRAVDYLLSKDG